MQAAWDSKSAYPLPGLVGDYRVIYPNNHTPRVTMDQRDQEWWEAFQREHGYYPHEDPNLLTKGLSPEQAVAEHLQARDWSEGFARGFGRPPTEDEYRSQQPRRYVNGHLVSGFGGNPPEMWGRQPEDMARGSIPQPRAGGVPVPFRTRGAIPQPPGFGYQPPRGGGSKYR